MKKIIGSALFSLLLVPLRFLFKPVLNALGGIVFSYLVRRSLRPFRPAPPSRRRPSFSFFLGLTGIAVALATLIHFVAWKRRRRKKKAAQEAEPSIVDIPAQEAAGGEAAQINPSFMQTGQPQQIIITLEPPRQGHPGTTKIELAYRPE